MMTDKPKIPYFKGVWHSGMYGINGLIKPDKGYEPKVTLK